MWYVHPVQYYPATIKYWHMQDKGESCQHYTKWNKTKHRRVLSFQWEEMSRTGQATDRTGRAGRKAKWEVTGRTHSFFRCREYSAVRVMTKQSTNQKLLNCMLMQPSWERLQEARVPAPTDELIGWRGSPTAQTVERMLEACWFFPHSLLPTITSPTTRCGTTYHFIPLFSPFWK